MLLEVPGLSLRATLRGMSNEDRPDPPLTRDLSWMAAIVLLVCAAFGGGLLLLLIEQVHDK